MAVVKSFQKKQDYTATIIIMTVLFFIWGLVSTLNGQLVPIMKKICHTKGVQNELLDLSFFGAYFLMSIPAVYVSKYLGLKKAVLLGLTLCALGALLFYPAAHQAMFSLFLLATFLLATGVTFLQLLANPYLTMLGSKHYASARLNLSQAFNSLGASFAPYITGFLIVGSMTNLSHLDFQEQLNIVEPVYLIIGVLFLILVLIFAFVYFPQSQQILPKRDQAVHFPSLKEKRIWYGAISIFLYVGVEVTVAGYIAHSSFDGVNTKTVLYYYWFLMMIGRFIGALVQLKINPAVALLIVAQVNVLLAFVLMIVEPKDTALFLIVIGLFNAIMFPTIFSLSIEKLKTNVMEGSALLMMAIIGGAIIPFMTSETSFTTTVSVIMAGYIGILLFAFSCMRKQL